MKNTMFEMFGITLSENVAQATDKKSKNARFLEVLEDRVSDREKSAITWDEFNALRNSFDIFPTQKAYKVAFGETKGAKLWADTAASWTALQVCAAVYFHEMGDVAADENKRRRENLGDYIHRLLQYHGWEALGSERVMISKKMLATIGDHAVKYVSTGAWSADTKEEGITAFIKTTHAIIFGYYKLEDTLDALKDKAYRLAEKAMLCADNDEHWNEHPYPACLTQSEKAALEDKLNS